MSLSTTYPGVYVQELPSGKRTITGVSTSTTAFIGLAAFGPVNEPTLIHDMGSFERIFGGISQDSMMSYAVSQYYLNGGKDAIIVRIVKPGATKAEFTVTGKASGDGAAPSFTLEATSEGSWANTDANDSEKGLRITIDKDVSSTVKDDQSDDTLFNLEILFNDDVETYRNLSLKETSSRYIVNVLEEESDYLRVKEGEDLPEDLGSSVTVEMSGDGGSDGEDSKGSGASKVTIEDNITGEQGDKTGIFALEKADIFNLLCIPPYSDDDETSDTVYATAAAYCLDRRAMLLVDPPASWNDVSGAVDGIGDFSLADGARNSAIFFPRIKAADTFDENRLHEFVPCGVVAGAIARTDAQRGIWKSPAGIETSLAGVPDLAYNMTDDENGELNPLGVNCLRNMTPYGRIIWGSRTMRGDDRLADQWKYLAVRRTALYIEESLYRGTKWVVFEPNDEPLWAQIRLNVGSFMHDLFKKGAFQGATPKDAYLVKCDNETTTQYDIDRGIVNILVGFAPLKPAEFVILKIQQLAGQEEV